MIIDGSVWNVYIEQFRDNAQAPTGFVHSSRTRVCTHDSLVFGVLGSWEAAGTLALADIRITAVLRRTCANTTSSLAPALEPQRIPYSNSQVRCEEHVAARLWDFENQNAIPSFNPNVWVGFRTAFWSAKA